MNQNHLDIKKIALVSTLLAMALVIDFVTGLIPGLNVSMPLGGRFFNLSLLPIILIGLVIGPLYGIIGAVLYGVLTFYMDGYALAYFTEDFLQASLVFMLDYVIAFGALGLSGFFKKSLETPLNFIVTTVTVMMIRWLSSTIVGALLWVTYASYNEWTQDLLNNVGQNAFLYSGIYNILYTLTSIISISVIGSLTLKQLNILKNQFQSNPIRLTNQ